MDPVNLVIVGFGVIGRGLAKTLAEKNRLIKDQLGWSIRVTAICERDGCLVNERGLALTKAISAMKKGVWKKHPDYKCIDTLDLLEAHPADIAVEVTPGNVKDGKPGLDHILASLKAGKHVVTSNKSPLALNYERLMNVSEKHERQLRFEATVGGSIPIIREGLALKRTNAITDVYGILNGTTNFILGKMLDEGVEFGVALREAQALGLAEPDPAYDIAGFDSAAKVAILANALLDKRVSFKDVAVTGIDGITPEAARLAREHGYVVKLIGDVASLSVAPRLVPTSHTLNVRGSLNAVMLATDVAGEVTLTGRGAGPRETSSALLSDLLDVCSSTR